MDVYENSRRFLPFRLKLPDVEYTMLCCVIIFQGVTPQKVLESLTPPWVVCFLVRERVTGLDDLAVPFPDCLMSVLAFHDMETGLH